jgi:hypothetical protein
MFSASQIRLNTPGSNVVLGLESMPRGIGHGVNFGQSYKNMDVPAPPPENSGTTYFKANTPIMYSYIMNPWSDGTERHVKEYMLVFNHVNVDQRRGMTTVVPIFKLNELLKQGGDKFKVSTSAAAGVFRQYMTTMGTAILDNYHYALKHDAKVAKQMEVMYQGLPEYYRMAKEDEFVHLTRFGITLNWRFSGAVVSKGESASLDNYSDVEASTEAIFTVGVSLAKRACVHNLWEGKIDAGTRLFFILQYRNGVYQYVPYATKTREYPPYDLRVTNGEDAHIISVGFVREAPAAKTDSDSSFIASGLTNDHKAAYMRTGMLPTMWIEINV